MLARVCVSGGYLNVGGGGGEFSHDTERKAPLQSRLAGYLMSLVIGSLWPLRIPALPLLMCAGTERERGGRRVGVTPTHQSHPPSIHPSLFLWLIAAANAAEKPPPSPVFSAATLKVPLHIFFVIFFALFLPPLSPTTPLRSSFLNINSIARRRSGRAPSRYLRRTYL